MATKIPKLLKSGSITQFSSVEDQIKETFSQLISKLKERKQQLLNKVTELREDFQSKEDARLAALEELENTQLQLEQMNVKVNENFDVHEKAGCLYQQAKEQHLNPATIPEFSFLCPTLSTLQSQISEFGLIEASREVEYSRKQDPLINVAKKGNDENEIDAAGLAIDEQAQKVYIADYNNSRVQVLTFQGEFVSQFGKRVLRKPCGIAITDNIVYLTDYDNHKIFQFCKLCHELSSTAGGYGSSEGQLSYPHGLCVDSTGDIFIADTWNNRVSVFTKDLKFKSIMGKGTLLYPSDVQVTIDKVLVLDRGKLCLHQFTKSGNLVSSCISQGRKEQRLVYEPYFFCLDREDNVIISNRLHHNVRVFSSSGEVLYTIGKRGSGKGEFEFPYGIAISDSGVLFVLSRNPNYSLQCF